MTLNKTLALIACAGMCVPAANAAVSLSDDTLKLEFGVRLQTRASMERGDDSAGNEFNIERGVRGKNDPVNFMMRRTRLYAKGTYQENWKFQFAIQGDDIERQANSGAASVRYAWVERQLKMGESLTHVIHFGLDKPFFNDADIISSSAMLMPTKRATEAHILKNRSVGLGYRLWHPMFALGADIQNVGGRVQPTANNVADNESEGFFYSARGEFSFSPEWFVAKRAESYCGKEGHAAVLGLEYGTERDRFTAINAQRTTSAYGGDILFWWNSITAIADLKWQKAETTTLPAGTVAPEVKAQVFTAQIGYAIPLEGGMAIEPAFRYAKIDTDTSTAAKDAPQNFSTAAFAEHGQSGSEFEVGLNLYMNGHGNKLSLQYSNWKANDGDARASIFRLQHQLNF
ncbi:MAG: hypothetical protein H0V44_14955 [Planctomycetes bacterium]|nr:hypothetical protein [Planctomycetota bacterium]